MNKLGSYAAKVSPGLKVGGNFSGWMHLTETVHFDRMRDLNNEKQGLCIRTGICNRGVCQRTAILGELSPGVEGGKPEAGIRDLALSRVSALFNDSSSGHCGD
jgi:hypothetical protein